MYLIWFDDSKKPVEEKIARALAHYQQRVGRSATVVLVHPSQVARVPCVVVRSCEEAPRAGVVQPNTFWLGVEG